MTSSWFLCSSRATISVTVEKVCTSRRNAFATLSRAKHFLKDSWLTRQLFFAEYGSTFFARCFNEVGKTVKTRTKIEKSIENVRLRR